MNAQQLLTKLYQSGIKVTLNKGELSVDAEKGALTSELLMQLKSLKPELVRLLSVLEHDNTKQIRIDNTPRTYPFEATASIAQERILFMEELSDDSSFYNVPFFFKISGRLNKAALWESFLRLVNKHDVLRTTYQPKENSHIQKVNDFVDGSLSTLPIHEEHIQLVDDFLKREANYTFSLASQWPIRVVLAILNEQEFILSINIHHVAVDGWSAKQIIKDLNEGYELYSASENIANTEAKGISTPSLQYVDYINWHNQWITTDSCQSDKQFWNKYLSELPELHNFPTDKVRPARLGHEGKTYKHVISQSNSLNIINEAKQRKISLFTLMQSVFSAFLSRYSGDTDIVFGTALANRQPLEFINTVGLFVNTAVLRYQLTKTDSLNTIVEQATNIHQQVTKHQKYPFDNIVDDLKPNRSLGYNPLFQIMLVMQDNVEDKLAFQDTVVSPIPQKQDVSKFDFTLHIKLSESSIEMSWEYNTRLFEANTIKDIAENFETFLTKIIQAPCDSYQSIDFIQPSMVNQDYSSASFEQPQCLHSLFERSCIKTPLATAVVCDEGDVTYQELNEKADKLAAYLFDQGVKPNARIGVCMEKSLPLIVSMLAIYKVGAVYVPLDPHYPSMRLAYMLDNASITLVLTDRQRSFQTKTEITNTTVNHILSTCEGTEYEPYYNVSAPAYIIYTSGSTGNPKGVEVSHQSLFYSLFANNNVMKFQAEDIMATIGSQAFGVSLLEILLPLISGATVQTINKQQSADIDELISRTNQSSVLHAVPSLMAVWIDQLLLNKGTDSYPNLRLLLVGAEPVPEKLLNKIKRWRPDIELRVLYGMTESSVVSSSYQADKDSPSCYCIGSPHANTQFFALNEFGCIQPRGVRGELHVGGLSLATKYINQPSLTKEKFIENGFSTGERLYKTGDSVRLLRNGYYEFIGRIDNQVSLRGVRIELGEIDAIAMAVDGVKQAVAHIIRLEEQQYLTLYLTLQSNSQINIASLVKHRLTEQLPEYMRPSFIEVLDKFPLNPNGKVDRKKLPEPTKIEHNIEAGSELERQLQVIWQDVLDCKSIGVTDNFFDVGGHSLLATQLISRVRTEFDISLSLKKLFESPTIRTTALLLESELSKKYLHDLTQPKKETNDDSIEELIL